MWLKTYKGKETSLQLKKVFNVPDLLVLINAYIDGVPRNVICKGTSKAKLVEQGELTLLNINLQEQLFQRESQLDQLLGDIASQKVKEDDRLRILKEELERKHAQDVVEKNIEFNAILANKTAEVNSLDLMLAEQCEQNKRLKK